MIKIGVTIGLMSLLAFRATERGYVIGDKVTEFSLQGTDDKWYSLDSFRNEKGLIVIFTCNTCPYAVANEPRIMSLHAKYEPLGYPVVAINPNDPLVNPGDSFEEMKARAALMNYRHYYLHDATQEVARQFGAIRTPEVFLLQRTNQGFTVKYIGAIDDSPRDESLITTKYTENAVDALLGGRDPNPPVVKSIGCTIKWRM